MSRRIFVYGTLQTGQRNHVFLRRAAWRIGWATVTGELFQLPFFNFPLYRPSGSGLVHGELYEVEEAALRILDQREKWYKRKATTCVVLGNCEMECDIYEALAYLPYWFARNLHGVWP